MVVVVVTWLVWESGCGVCDMVARRWWCSGPVQRGGDSGGGGRDVAS
jgi:hypothetical protein